MTQLCLLPVIILTRRQAEAILLTTMGTTTESDKQALLQFPFSDLGELQQENRRDRTYRVRLALFLSLFFAAFIYLCRNSRSVFEAELLHEDLGYSHIAQSSLSTEEREALFLYVLVLYHRNVYQS